jgi:hypothetical protein
MLYRMTGSNPSLFYVRGELFDTSLEAETVIARGTTDRRFDRSGGDMCLVDELLANSHGALLSL